MFLVCTFTQIAQTSFFYTNPIHESINIYRSYYLSLRHHV